MTSRPRRLILPLAALTIVVATVSGCTSIPGTPSGASGPADGVVSIEGPLIGQDAVRLEKSWTGWEKANHITIRYTGSANFQEGIGTEAQQGNAPDLAIFAQPGLIDDLAGHGLIRKLPPSVLATAGKTFPARWAGYTTVGGTDYAAPLLSQLDGWVFYSPSTLAKFHQRVPTTWAELLTLTEYLRAETNSAPWCEGFSANASSGSVGASFVDDMVLREDGPTVYDQWVNHTVKFSDPQIVKAFNDAGEILQNDGWVNAGFVGVSSINTTTSAQVADALVSGKCELSYEPSSFLDQVRETTNGIETISPEGKLWAFLLPPITAGTVPFTESGDFVAAFSNDADTVKVQNYLASLGWAKSRMKLGGAMSPATGIYPFATPNSLLQGSVAIVQGSATISRLSASDQMPAIVGEGTFLSGIVNWTDDAPLYQVTATIDGSWPKS